MGGSVPTPPVVNVPPVNTGTSNRTAIAVAVIGGIFSIASVIILVVLSKNTNTDIQQLQTQAAVANYGSTALKAQVEAGQNSLITEVANNVALSSTMAAQAATFNMNSYGTGLWEVSQKAGDRVIGTGTIVPQPDKKSPNSLSSLKIDLPLVTNAIGPADFVISWAYSDKQMFKVRRINGFILWPTSPNSAYPIPTFSIHFVNHVGLQLAENIEVAADDWTYFDIDLGDRYHPVAGVNNARWSDVDLSGIYIQGEIKPGDQPKPVPVTMYLGNVWLTTN